MDRMLLTQEKVMYALLVGKRESKDQQLGLLLMCQLPVKGPFGALASVARLVGCCPAN